MAINVRERVKAQRKSAKVQKCDEIVVRNQDGEIIDLIEIHAYGVKEIESIMGIWKAQGYKLTCEDYTKVPGEFAVVEKPEEFKPLRYRHAYDLCIMQAQAIGRKIHSKTSFDKIMDDLCDKMGNYELAFKSYPPTICWKFYELAEKVLQRYN